MEELEDASNMLGIALNRYIKVCSTIESSSISRTLLDRVARELARIDSYEAKMCEAKALMGRASNYSVERKTINSLPTEILLQISQLAYDNHECCLDAIDNSDHHAFPSRIEPLLQVCARWRRTFINSCFLWTHLDLVDEGHEFHRRLLSRAETYATRAGDSPLSLHIYESRRNTSPSAFSQFDDFVTLISPRLSVVQSEPYDRPWYHLTLFSRSLIHAVPGLLTQLVIFNSLLADNGYEAPENSTLLVPSNQPIGNTETLRLITTLRLHDVYFQWNSPAYNGLVELSLTLSHPYPLIKESELAEVLRSSPQLKKLWLRIRIAEPAPGSSAPEPVTLKDLRVLRLRMNFDHLGFLLRLINPGPEPLRMFASVSSTEEPTGDEHWHSLEQFFARSNVTRLRIWMRSWVNYPWVPDLLARLPNTTLLELELEDRSWFHHMALGNQTVGCTVGTLSVRESGDAINAFAAGLGRLIRALKALPITVNRLNVRLSDRVAVNQEMVEELTELCAAINCEFIVSRIVPDSYWY